MLPDNEFVSIIPVVLTRGVVGGLPVVPVKVKAVITPPVALIVISQLLSW